MLYLLHVVGSYVISPAIGIGYLGEYFVTNTIHIKALCNGIVKSCYRGRGVYAEGN